MARNIWLFVSFLCVFSAFLLGLDLPTETPDVLWIFGLIFLCIDMLIKINRSKKEWLKQS